MRTEEEIRAEIEEMKSLWENSMSYNGTLPMPRLGGTLEYWANRLDAKIQFAKWVLNEEE